MISTTRWTTNDGDTAGGPLGGPFRLAGVQWVARPSHLRPESRAPRRRQQQTATQRGLALAATVLALLCGSLTAVSADQLLIPGPGSESPELTYGFGSEPVGHSLSLTLVVHNTSDRTAHISNVAPISGDQADFSWSGLGPGSSIGAGQTANLSVTFQPTGEGPKAMLLDVYSDFQYGESVARLEGTGVAPHIQVSPLSLDFGNQKIGTTSGARTVQIANSGTADLHLGNAGLQGADSGSFAITQIAGNGTISPGNATTISVKFEPSVVGPHNASLSIPSDAPEGTKAVSLTGNGILGPILKIGFGHPTLNFGSQTVGSTSHTQDVNLTNGGDAPLVINNVALGGDNPGDFSFSPNPSGTTIEPGGSRSVSVSFTPSIAGSRSATLSISSNADDNPQTVSLVGNGVLPTEARISINPTSLNFSAQVGLAANGQVTISSMGNASLSVSLSLGGSNPSSFSIAGGRSFTVPPGESRNVALTFSPSFVGSYSATLTVNSNDASNSWVTVSLAGTGTPSPPQSHPRIGVSPAGPLGFGDQAVRTTSASQTVTLTNVGTGLLQIDRSTITGANAPDFVITRDDGAASVDVGQRRTLSISFKPTAPGPRTATLVINSNAENGPQSVSLSGNGVNIPTSNLAGTWAVQPPSGAAVSLTADAQARFTLWAVSADRRSLETAQGSLNTDGSFLAASLDNALQFHGQIAADRSTLTVTAERPGATIVTAVAPHMVDSASPLPSALTGTFHGKGGAVNGDQIEVWLSVAPGGQMTSTALVTRPGIAGALSELGTFFVMQDGSLILPNPPGPDGSLTPPAPGGGGRPGTIGGGGGGQVVSIGALQPGAAAPILTYQFDEGSYQNTFQVPLQRD